jgi:heme/copper-type cytochrome/quinol oxidase subunit 3
VKKSSLHHTAADGDEPDGNEPDGNEPGGSQPDHAAEPPQTTTMRRFGLRLFMISLAVFFAGGMFVYVVTSMARPPSVDESPTSLPAIAWLSTLLLLFAGMAIEVAVQGGRWGIIDSRRALLMASGLSIGFVATQIVAVFELLGHHRAALRTNSIGLYGLTLVLMLIHAAHIVGGLIPLNILARRAWNHRLTWKDQHNLRGCATYWHFLELVWLSMFVAFLLLG